MIIVNVERRSTYDNTVESINVRENRINNRQSRDTGNIGYTRQRMKTNKAQHPPKPRGEPRRL